VGVPTETLFIFSVDAKIFYARSIVSRAATCMEQGTDMPLLFSDFKTAKTVKRYKPNPRTVEEPLEDHSSILQ
jgi:hypothetical protein